eukprot:gene28663-32028_t
MRAGRVLETGPVEQILSAPKHDYTKEDKGSDRMTAEPILALEAIRKVFSANGRQVRALNGVSITLGRGETLGVIGESGSGKSTLGRIAVGLEMPDEGIIRIEGTDISRLSVPKRREALRHCQMVFQDPYSSLNPRLTIGRQIGEGIFLAGASDWKEIGGAVADLLEKAIVEDAQHPYTRMLLEAVPRLGRRRSGERREAAELPVHGDEDRFEAVSPGHWILRSASATALTRQGISRLAA